MKKILALILALVMCFGLVACGSSGDGGDAGSEGGTIKVGYVNPYTGPLAGNGEGCDWERLTPRAGEEPSDMPDMPATCGGEAHDEGA